VPSGGLDPLRDHFQRDTRGNLKVGSSQESIITGTIEIARLPLEAGQILKPDV
jgi:hypothetical protein